MINICAIMRQTWYEAAKKNMPEIERLLLYEAIYNYEFYDTNPEGLPLAVQVVFDMVRGELDQDKAKMRKRAEVNRINGQLGGRPKSNKQLQIEENPLGFSKTQQNPYIHIQLQDTTTNYMSVPFEDIHTHFLILLELFERGTIAPFEEKERFYNYYRAQGWKTSNGAEIKDVVALARVWKVREQAAMYIKRRSEWTTMIRACQMMEDMEVITEFIRIEHEKYLITIVCRSERLMQIIENKYISKVAKYIQDNYEDGTKLSYKVMTPEA